MTPDHPKPPQRPQGADWLSWFLHLFLGLAIGAVAGFLIAIRMLDEETIPCATIGAALFCGAITSYRGNRAWFHPLSLPPDDPAHSAASRVCSFLLGAVGVVVFFWPMAKRVNRSLSSFEPKFDIPLLVVLALLVGWLVYELREDNPCREKNPLWFWIYVAMIGLSIIGGLAGIFG